MGEGDLELEGVEDAYPLTSAQLGMLFHTLAEPGSGVYIGCFSAGLPDTLDLPVFKAAWEKVAERHQAMRTVFVWDGLDVPVQVVLESPKLKWEEARWPQDTEEQQTFLSEIQQGGVDLNVAPTTRFILMQTDAGHFHFAWICHHALIDDWSASQIMAEVAETYAALSKSADPDLEEAMPFRSFVDWALSADIDRAKEYWRKQLADYEEPATIQLPRPEKQTAPVRHQKSLRFKLSEQVNAQLSDAARQLKVTPNAIIGTVWGLVLQRLTGQDDVLFGLAVTQRPAELEGIETAVGNFVTTIPIRVKLGSSLNLRSLVQNYHQMLLCAREHSTLSLNDLRDMTSISPNTAMFESILSVETRSKVYKAAGRLFDEPKGLDRSNFPLSVIVGVGTEIACEVRYDADRFAPDGAACIRDMLKQAFISFARHLDDMPTELSVTDEPTPLPLDGEALPPFDLVHNDILKHARKTPEKVALIYEDTQFTYGELERLSKVWALALLEIGVTNGARVGVFMQRHPMAVVGMLAALRAGCAYVPVNADGPRERGQSILHRSDCAVVLTLKDFARHLPDHSGPIICLDAPLAEPSGGTLPVIDPDSAAYVIYTSGSTGNPKGVVVSNRNLAASTAARLSFYPESPKCFLLLSSIEFDSSVVGIYWTLSTGGTLVIPKNGHEQDMSVLRRLIEAHSVTHLLGLPSLLELLFTYAGQGALKSLRAVISAGEELTDRCFHTWKSHLSHARLYNEYGPSEATVWCVACDLTDAAAARTHPIGRPIPGVTAYVQDHHGRYVPPGLPGELLIGGAGVASGYLNAPDLTAEKFIPDPADPSAKLYRTGDLVRMRPDGMLEYLGRIDQQVKIRGHRIEIGEIESVLTARQEIASAAVKPVQLGADLQLAAFVVLEHGTVLAVDDLRDALRRRLPEWMIPSRFVVLADMPQTATGKIDRKSLVLPANEAGGDIILPRTPLERDLAEIWEEVLWLDRDIGVNEDFAQLGGHSLLSIRLVNELDARLKTRLPAGQIGRLTTIEDQARQIEKANRSEQGNTGPMPEPTKMTSRLFEGLSEEQLNQMHAYMAGWPGEPVWEGSMFRGLNIDGSLPPLFWCFNWGKEFAALAEALGPDQPIYGTRSGHLVLDVVPETQQWDNRRVAMQTVDEVLKIQPEGPFYLGGNCQGAAIAMETAQVMQGLALPVGLVMMMEAATEHAFHGRVALLFGDQSEMNPFAGEGDPEALWRQRYLSYSFDTLKGRHGQFFNEKNINHLSGIIARRLMEARESLVTAKAGAQQTGEPNTTVETPDKSSTLGAAVGALLEQARALEKAGEPGPAKRVLQAALDLDPDHFGTLKQLSLLSVAAGDARTAITQIDRALQVQDDPQLRVHLARLEKASGRISRLRRRLASSRANSGRQA